MLKVGINGFGRIGRLAARTILQKYKDKLSLVCINTSGRMDVAGWTHLFEYDSTYGKYPGKVSAIGRSSSGRENNLMVVDGMKIPVLGEPEPAKIPWGKYQTEIVIESTGVFRDRENAQKHLRDTVKKVIISAPPKDENIPMFVIGVNEKNSTNEQILSSASCTTNCVSPVVKVVNENFGIQKALMTTVHAYTSDQRLLDNSHPDLRRARSAAVNMVPTSTGAAKATTRVYPVVAGKFDGLAIRVPVKSGSLTDFTFVTKKQTAIEEVNQAFVRAAETDLKDILGITQKPLVSSDIIGLELSALVDLSLTKVIGGDLVKVVAWYDNEWGYAQRLIEQVLLVG